MKPDIHPEYRDVLFHDTSSDTYFVVGSTVQTSETKEHEGQTYPYMTLDISSASHPFYTCLLYTSPSPRDVEESRMPSSA